MQNNTEHPNNNNNNNNNDNNNRKRKAEARAPRTASVPGDRLESSLERMWEENKQQSEKKQRLFDERKSSTQLPSIGHSCLVVHHATHDSISSVDTLLLPATLSREDHESLAVCNGRTVASAGEDGRCIGYLLGLEGYDPFDGDDPKSEDAERGKDGSRWSRVW
jgi:hypothetical protein